MRFLPELFISLGDSLMVAPEAAVSEFLRMKGGVVVCIQQLDGLVEVVSGVAWEKLGFVFAFGAAFFRMASLSFHY